MTKVWLRAALGALLTLAGMPEVWAQGAVLQSGSVVPGDGVQWLANGIIADTGQAWTEGTSCALTGCTLTGPFAAPSGTFSGAVSVGGTFSAPNFSAQVATNAALKALTAGQYPTVYRAGFTTAGDGGAAVYNWSSTACSIAGGDNGSQVAPNSGTGCWLLDFSRGPITPMIWGAAGNGTTNDSAAVQAAVSAMANRTLYWGAHLYGISTGIVAASPIALAGDGGGEGIYATGCASGLVPLTANINVITLEGPGSSVSGTCINGGGVTNTAGAGIVAGAINSITVSHNQINRECFGVDISGNGTSQNEGALVDGNTITTAASSACAAIRIGVNSTAANTVNSKITNNEIYCNNASMGFLILDAGGPYISHNTPYSCSYGTKIFPGAGQAVIWATFDSTVLGDTSSVDDMLIDTAASNALVNGLQFLGSWASASTGGPSILIQDSAASGGIYGLHFVGHRTYMGTNEIGFDIKAGVNATIDSSTVCAGATSTGTGILIEVGASETMVRNNRVGLCDHPTSGTLATGVSVTQTVSNFVGQIAGNDFTNSTTPVNYAPSGGAVTTAIIKDNIGLDNIVASVASAASIALPPNPVVDVTGTTTITTMTGAWSNRIVTLVPAAAVPFATGGNICNGLTATVNVPVLATYNATASCWNLK